MEARVGDYEAALPAGVRSRMIDNGNGLLMHVLEAGHGAPNRPMVLLLHGFPEIAFSWRRVIPALADAGYHVVAPDHRGFGRTTGWDRRYDGEVRSFHILNIVRDTLGLLAALGRKQVAAVVGHDSGSFVAAWSALLRPDVFRSVTLMSAPFAGPPPVFDSGPDARPLRSPPDMDAALAALPRPRKHYQTYYCTREANDDMWKCPQGVHAFLRAYFHHKSADWKANRPFPLTSWAATELEKMPTYYIMERDLDMAQNVAVEMPSPAEIAACRWLTEDDLAVYAAEYGRNGFQGGLQWYRTMRDARVSGELQVFAGRRIEIPSMFVAGSSDWGIHQRPGDLEFMRDHFLADIRGCHLIDGAGHWVQQEQSDEVIRLLKGFIASVA